MSGRAVQIALSLAVLGVGALLWRQMDEAGVTEDAATDVSPFSAETAWGEPDLSGVWLSEAHGAGSGHAPFDLAALEGLYSADGRARMQALAASDDPTLRCAPPAFPRAAMLGRPIQIFQRPGFAYILTEAYPSFRSIPTTGRPHTEGQYLYPTYLGDSTGRWDGDTLVVDVTGFNGYTWFDRAGNFHSDALHVVERWTPLSPYHIRYEATIEDPNVFTRPWTMSFTLYKHIDADAQLVEFNCVPFVERLMYEPLGLFGDE